MGTKTHRIRNRVRTKGNELEVDSRSTLSLVRATCFTDRVDDAVFGQPGLPDNSYIWNHGRIVYRGSNSSGVFPRSPIPLNSHACRRGIGMRVRALPPRLNRNMGHGEYMRASYTTTPNHLSHATLHSPYPTPTPRPYVYPVPGNWLARSLAPTASCSTHRGVSWHNFYSPSRRYALKDSTLYSGYCSHYSTRFANLFID